MHSGLQVYRNNGRYASMTEHRVVLAEKEYSSRIVLQKLLYLTAVDREYVSRRSNASNLPEHVMHIVIVLLRITR